MEYLGFGLGIRNRHFSRVLSAPVQAEWFEALTENYLGMEGFPHSEALNSLLKVRENFPITLHGVSLSIGSADPINQKYLRRLKRLQEIIQPAWISDHLCWTGMNKQNLHDLLPIPFTDELLDHVANRVEEVQNFLGRSLVLENVSAYVSYSQSTMDEFEFLGRLVRKTGCRLLVDINNIYVNSVNHDLDAMECLRAIPKGAVQQLHLAGHTKVGNILIDSHGASVCAEVWRLYGEAVRIFDPISTIIEWDENIPEYEVLEAEMLRAKGEFHAMAARSENI